MTHALQIPSLPAADELQGRIQHFYARQMQLLDSGRTAEWARTFTDDGVFDAGGQPEPVRGRSAIAEGAGQVAAKFAEAGIVRRHLISMLTVDPADDGTVHARSYAVVLEIPRGGDVTVRRSTVCEDVLVPAGETWLVRHRRVTRDGLD
jgi:3-phenylpropionate/cinnamic acid dioxygenase small subunit